MGNVVREFSGQSEAAQGIRRISGGCMGSAAVIFFVQPARNWTACEYMKPSELPPITPVPRLRLPLEASLAPRSNGQQSFALSYHLQKHTRLYAEVFSQNNSQSNTPPGTYAFGGFFHQFSDSFGLDGGMRFGITDHSARVGTTIGLVFGRQLHPKPAPQRNQQ